MCGRFYINIDLEEIMLSYKISNNYTEGIKNFQAGEMFPGTDVPVIFSKGNKSLSLFHWGFKIPGINKEIINIRTETVLDKPVFRKPFMYKRCIIPANSFYEWKVEGKSKIKYEISLEDRALFSMAALYEEFTDLQGKEYKGMAILTVESKEPMAQVHSRMPVILTKETEELWLSGNFTDIDMLREMIMDNSKNKMQIKAVDGVIQLSF